MGVSVRKILLILLGLALAACSPADASRGIERSQQAIAAFHKDMNAGKFDDIYYASAKEMHDAVDVAGFEQLLGAVQRKLGKAGNSKQVGWHVNYTNGSTYVTLTMETMFDKDKATETFIYVTSDESTKLVGYNIQSLALITQ